MSIVELYPRVFQLEAILALALFALSIAMLVAYFVRVYRSGRPHFERIEQQGGTKLLGKRMLEIGYWAIQPAGIALARSGVSANALSWVSAIVGALSGLLAAYGHFGFAAVALAVSGLLDVFDGMIAKMTKTTSEGGYVLDSCLDRYVEFFFLTGLIFFYRDYVPGLALTILSLLGSYMVSYVTLMARFKGINLPAGSVIMRRVERMSYLIIGSAFSSVSLAFFERHNPIGYPMIAALGLIALLSNYSALKQLFLMIRKVDERISPKILPFAAPATVAPANESAVPRVQQVRQPKVHMPSPK